MERRTIYSCLVTIGVTLSSLEGAPDITEEFQRVKKIYFKGCLVHHPDKGGSEEVFKSLLAAWEVVRDLYDKRQVHAQGFPYYFAGVGVQQEREVKAPKGGAAGGPRPSWEWFQETANEPVPTYMVERAKSGRSACVEKSVVVSSTGCLQPLRFCFLPFSPFIFPPTHPLTHSSRRG